MKKVVRPEITEGEAHFEEFSPSRRGVRWMECNLAFELLRRLRTPTARMRYESLATGPARGGRTARSTGSTCRPPRSARRARRG